MELQDEFTEKMHSEFTVSEEVDQQLRAGCVWRVLGYDAPKEEVEKWAESYGTTYDTCMKWKSYWRNLAENSKRCHTRRN